MDVFLESCETVQKTDQKAQNLFLHLIIVNLTKSVNNVLEAVAALPMYT